MLPKIQPRKQVQSYYPKLPMGTNNDENIHKLKLIQQFLEEDNYALKTNPLRHHKQSSLHTYRFIENENTKKYVPNSSNELYHKGNNKENCQKREVTTRPKTRRQGLRLSELIDLSFRDNNKGIKKELNFKNYKML